MTAGVPAVTTMRTSIQREPLSEPSCQKMICSRLAVSVAKRMSASPALAKAFTAMPVSRSVTTSVRPRERAVA